MVNRGAMNNHIQDKAKEVLGREITLTELRLYPYIDYCNKNHIFYPERINAEERKILLSLRGSKLLEYSSSPSNAHISLSKVFYQFLCDVLWESYVEKIEVEE